MTSLRSRLIAGVLLALLAWLALAGASPKKTSLLEPDKLIILSTTDVKGKVSPCG